MAVQRRSTGIRRLVASWLLNKTLHSGQITMG